MRAMSAGPYAQDLPGGGAVAYCDWMVAELMPLLGSRYGITTAPEGLAFGGSSFG
jgi:predicted alpha/beta superfamily hydrolase